MPFQGIATVSTSVNLTALPTIEEQATITKQDEDAADKHKSIAEVFPDQQKEAAQQQQPERRGSERRKRNTSESNTSAKFQVGYVEAALAEADIF